MWKVSVLQNDHDETSPIEPPLGNPLWVTMKVDAKKCICAGPTSLKNAMARNQYFFANKFRRWFYFKIFWKCSAGSFLNDCKIANKRRYRN